jgi:signal transduction histidine kinase
MQSVLDIDILLNLILTCITAGCALGFSRAIIFMMDEKTNVLEGRMGVGPVSAEMAHQIWDELAKAHANLEEFLSRFGLRPPNKNDVFNLEVQNLRVNLEEKNNILVQTVLNQKSYWIKNSNQLIAQDFVLTPEIMNFFQPEEFVTVPLITKERVIGIVLADNKYSSVPLRDDQISLLKLFANHAALALENAEAYRILEDKVQQLAETLKALRETQDKLLRTERLATIGQMAAHVAHEIRNPLTAIGGFAKSVLKDPKNTDQVKMGAQIIDKEVHRLETILRNVLDFTRISRPFRRKKNINQIIHEIVTLQQAILREDISLNLELAEDIQEFYFDDEQIKQAVMNVFSNSILSIKSKGQVTIRTLKKDSQVIIEIKDTGIGISNENIENIFNPFFTTRQDGTGLGLAVTQRILEGHDGKIEVESKEKKGSTFRLILPLILKVSK